MIGRWLAEGYLISILMEPVGGYRHLTENEFILEFNNCKITFSNENLQTYIHSIELKFYFAGKLFNYRALHFLYSIFEEIILLTDIYLYMLHTIQCQIKSR